MVEAHHEIAELDLNPVLAGPSGAIAVDFRDQGRERSATAAVASYLALAFGPQSLFAQSRRASASIRSRRS